MNHDEVGDRVPMTIASRAAILLTGLTLAMTSPVAAQAPENRSRIAADMVERILEGEDAAWAGLADIIPEARLVREPQLLPAVVQPAPVPAVDWRAEVISALQSWQPYAPWIALAVFVVLGLVGIRALARARRRPARPPRRRRRGSPQGPALCRDAARRQARLRARTTA